MWILIFILAQILIIPIYFLSVEHIKLQDKYGREKGIKIGNILGMISGWGYFGFWIGIWISPQPRFTINFLRKVSFSIFSQTFTISIFQLILGLLIILPGAWLGIKGVIEIGLSAAETHRSEKIITDGLYAYIRHPQYLGALLAHIGISIIFSAWYSLLLTPLMILISLLYSWKEEKELIKEFGEDYEFYKAKVPMLIPRIRDILLSFCILLMFS